MVTKVNLAMLQEKVIKNADVVDGILVLQFSDGTEKNIPIEISGGDEGGPVVGKSGTLAGAVSMSPMFQKDSPLIMSEPIVVPQELRVTLEVTEPGSYYVIASVNVVGCHESKGGETVTVTYWGKSWTYNSRNTSINGQITLDTGAAISGDCVVPGGAAAMLPVTALYQNVPVGTHVFAFGLAQYPREDQTAFRQATLAVFRV